MLQVYSGVNNTKSHSKDRYQQYDGYNAASLQTIQQNASPQVLNLSMQPHSNNANLPNNQNFHTINHPTGGGYSTKGSKLIHKTQPNERSANLKQTVQADGTVRSGTGGTSTTNFQGLGSVSSNLGS